jgi:hypothetical protein
MQMSVPHHLLGRAGRSVRGSLALLVATLTVLFTIHVSACAACSSPNDNHNAARTTRLVHTDYLTSAKDAGKSLSGSASGDNGAIAVLVPAPAAHVVPPVALQTTSSVIFMADSRNTSLAHRAVTVLLI